MSDDLLGSNAKAVNDSIGEEAEEDNGNDT